MKVVSTHNRNLHQIMSDTTSCNLCPPPSFFTGNITQLRQSGETPLTVMHTWGKKYGKIFGYFVGTRATLVVSEVNLVKEILVKNRKSCGDRPPLIVKMEPVTDTLVGLRGRRWSHVRGQLSPIFAKASLREMGRTMAVCVAVTGEILAEKVNKRGGGGIDVWKLYQGLTCDVISRCALAMEVNSQRDNDGDEFLAAVRGFLQHAMSPFILLALCFPSIAKVAEVGMKAFGVSHLMTRMIMTSVTDALQNRRRGTTDRKQNNNSYVDVLQFMLNSGKLSDPEILANSWIFILGGFETTASALTFSTLLLAQHQDVQEKLASELEKVLGVDEIPTYDQIQNVKYLDKVVSECLRLYPPVATFVTRHVNRDMNFGGITLTSGSTVQVPIWEIHHDPNLWPDPEHFDPERFNPAEKVGRHPMAFIPFGAGPRSCIGARFALTEIKMALAHIFMKFRVHAPPIDWAPKLAVPTVTLVPGEEIKLTFSLRRNVS
ncbi:cytochrome P450 3A24 isoform X2 [Folsomia candida]|uniref:cytochrome P450 3A24 isoform X2 n=1 Tax=Folsomia candida TaxID=158441 RepID=UPI001605337F|nr:cytochrome P450 3A24 isoform X2 [Folsomia candida]XP_035703969.1 cytochrome P450 3A24 isoform X2 [Folsomia candida]XP_035703970.1 cytochrome P450 3A24 isoform X2 [Folsomia candida]